LTSPPLTTVQTTVVPWLRDDFEIRIAPLTEQFLLEAGIGSRSLGRGYHGAISLQVPVWILSKTDNHAAIG
jgi:hypothetical protein